jgi:large subunit ribosomal protein L17
MHRHGYKGRKFHRGTDERRALMKGLADSLIKYGSIETTLAKAKEVVPYTEKLVTKAKVGDLHNRRLIIAALNEKATANKLVDEIAPLLQARNSGHFRIERTALRRGDNAQLARVSFVDELTKKSGAKNTAATDVSASKTEKKEDAKATAEKSKDNSDTKTKPKAKSEGKK